MGTVSKIRAEVSEVKLRRKAFNARQDEVCSLCKEKRGNFSPHLCIDKGFHHLRIPIGG